MITGSVGSGTQYMYSFTRDCANCRYRDQSVEFNLSQLSSQLIFNRQDKVEATRLILVYNTKLGTATLY